MTRGGATGLVLSYLSSYGGKHGKADFQSSHVTSSKTALNRHICALSHSRQHPWPKRLTLTVHGPSLPRSGALRSSARALARAKIPALETDQLSIALLFSAAGTALVAGTGMAPGRPVYLAGTVVFS